ncbi:hypothetical protein Patl1_08812 [Pistacia atlantica]
MPTCC